MPVSGINTTTNNVSAQGASGSSAMDKESFLQMFMAEVKYQDPLSPMSNSEQASQLAQYSQLEQLQSMNTTLTQSLEANYVLTNSINNSMATGLIGKEIKAASDEFTRDASSDNSKLYFDLGNNAQEVTVRIYNEHGDLVKSIKQSNMDAGANCLTWDGKTTVGSESGAGKYTYKVEAFDQAGNYVAATPFISITIDGIKYKDGAPFLIAGNEEVPFGNVMEIWDSKLVNNDNNDDDSDVIDKFTAANR